MINQPSPSCFKCIAVFLFLFFVSCPNIFANDDQSLSPYFLVTGDPSIDRLPLKDTDVQIAISGVIADIRVTQRYRNEGRRPINATYIFPASTRAAVYAMRMRIGNEVIVARIKAREDAKREFEAAKKQGKSASLLEQERPNIFSMKMANLMPKEEIEVELRYTELLIPTKGVYEMVYPTVVGPRYTSGRKSDNPSAKTSYKSKGEKPDSKLQISAQVSAGVPIQNLRSTSHSVVPNFVDATIAEIHLDKFDPFVGNRDFILRYSLAGNQIETGLLLYEGRDENFFLFMAQPPERVKADAIPPREYIFVVDVSGSMEGFPLNTSKRLLEDLIGRLGPNDYFNVVLFAGDSNVLSETPIVANKANISRAIQLMEEQRGLGGTELLGGLRRAMEMPHGPGVSRSVVLVTDGYISAEEGVFQYIRDNLFRTNVFSFGIGSSVNRHLIEGVAKAGSGEPFVITDESEAANTATTFREYIESPVLTDITVMPVGFGAYDIQPLRQPDLFAERPLVLFGKWRGPAVGTIELRGKTGSGDFLRNVDISGLRSNEANSALRYLWARSKIDELSDYGVGSITDESKDLIKALGLKYNLLTKYTSFIAVRELVKNPDGSATDVNQRLPLPVGVSNLAIGSEPGILWLIAVLALIALTFVFFQNKQVFLTPLRRLMKRQAAND